VNPEQSLDPEPSFADLLEAYEKGRQAARRAGDEPREGVVAAISGDRVFVDIGAKSEAVLPVAELKEPVQRGDKLLVVVVGRDNEGYLLLSPVIAERPRDWSSLERAFESQGIIAGRVTEAVKGGLRVDVGVGVPAFLPASRSGAREQADLEALIGQEIRCRVTRLDVEDENIIVDRRGVLEEEAQAARERRLAELQPGVVARGTVRSLTDFGAFVDLGGIDGLLHASDMSWSRVPDPRKFLRLGEEVEVQVLSVERAQGKPRIALGIKQLAVDPWTTVMDRLRLGDRVRGPVTKLMDFGAFVEIEPGIEGLIHISEMSWTRRVRHPQDVLRAGDVVEAVVLGINVNDRRVSLGLKQALGDPWDDAGERFGVGKVVEGTVRSLQKFGAFVELAEGVEGLLHISDITTERRLNHPNEALQADQKVRAIVTEFDREKKRIKLSMKQLEPDDTDEYIRDHGVGDRVTGRVARIEGGEARVELGGGVVGTYRLSRAAPAAPSGTLAAQLAAVWKPGATTAPASGPGAEEVKPGEVRSFRITALDAGSKRIELGAC
jgi:small subunit ribosomal protein S1